MKMNKKSLTVLIIIIAVIVTLASVFVISLTSKKSISNLYPLQEILVVKKFSFTTRIKNHHTMHS